MAQEDNLHKLYINLTDDGYNLGTEDEFRKKLQNKATAEKFHQNMVDDGYQLGSFDEFVSMNGLSYQMPQSQLPADQVERRVQTARVPQPGERIEATHVDKDGNVLQTDTTQLVRGKVATVEIGTPQFTPPSSHEGEELARRNGYYNTKESLDDSFSYRPNEYGEMRYGWQRGQRIKQLNRTGLEFMNRTGAYDENYDQAASQAEKMSDAQLVAEFNKLSGQIADAEALAGTADGYAMATVLRAYSHELRARDIGFAHGSENKKGIGQYQAAKQDPAVAAEILKQEAMSPEQRKAYLANAYKHIMAGEEGAPDIAMLAGTMIHAKESGIFPEEAYSQVVGIINNEHAEDVLAGALQSADAEIERLSQLIEQRTQQLYAEDEAEGMSLAKVMQHAESGSGAPIFNQRLLNDPELSMLWTAKRAAERRKKVIERKQDNHGFMRQFIGTFWDTATDINTWDFGIQDMRDAVNLVSLGNNKGSDAPMERAREAMLQNTVDAQEAEQRWRLSAAQRWGVIGGQALPFVAEFIGTGGGFSGVRQGVTKGVTSFIEKSLGKAASSKAAQWLVRSTGMLTGDIASALLMTNTTGSMKTYADILDRKTGDLMQLYDGTFVFRNSTTMGDAILKGEVANTLEYYTEMLGNHLDGLISGAGKRLGLSRLSEGMKWLTGRQIQQLTTNVLRQGGINELPSEILEEEANLILNAMLVGDNNFSTGPLKELANKFGCNFEVDPNSEDYQRSIFNPETQADIWGGMLFSIGAMRAPSVAIGTVGQGIDAAKYGWNAANYYYYKHKTDLAGTKLYGLVGGDELLDRINNTTNDQIPSLVAGILADDEFTPDVKSLAMDYIGNLVKERGYNVRMFDNAKDLDPEQDQEEGETIDLSYQEGYNASDEEQAGVKERVDVARAWLYNLGFDDSNIASLDSEEYRNAMAAYDGMLQHVQDDVDTAIAESDAAVDQQTHPETGAVHHAVLKTGGEVWVVGGNVALTPEGNIDIENSDGDLIVLDPATGGKRMIHISDLASADEPVMADQLKQEAAATIQETMATDASNRIDGVLSFQPGDEYTLPFGEEQHTITIIGDAGDGVNTVVSVDGGEQQLMPMQMIQEAADAQREARIAEQAAMEAAAGAATQETAEPVEEEQPAEEVTEEQPAEDAMPMNGDEVDWFATSPERGHRYLYEEAGLSPEEADAVVANSVKDAEKELEKVSKKAPKPGNAAQLNKYRAEKAAHEQQVAAAQAAVDYWKGVQAVQQQIQMDAVRAQAEERAARDAAERQAAIEAEEQYQAEQAAKKAEQAERGPFSAGAAVTEKWNAAPKVDGVRDQITLADGTAIAGHYVLVEAGAATPSHDPANGWKQSEGFPVDENGGTVNDRDYERDQAAQEITIRMSETYDSRAAQSIPVVTSDGVVLSGNGRTIAGDLAAQAGTDGAYINYLKEFGGKYGFNAEQVGALQHPRVLFVPDDAMPYTPETFARFNAQEMKGQNLTETAVKLGKTVDDATFNDVVGMINRYDTMADFYADESAATQAINRLLQGGVINPMQFAQMFDGDKVSGQGKEMLENLLLGKAFEGNPDAIRQLTEMPSVRQQIVSSLAEIANNSALSDYSLEDAIAQAISLVYQARKGGIKQGDTVTNYARQLSLFPSETGATVADYRNAMVLLLGDILNGKAKNTLKYILTLYNRNAAEAASGQMDLFSGAVKDPETILKETIDFINQSSKNELKQEIKQATSERKAAAESGGEAEGGEQTEPATERSEAGRGTDAAVTEAAAQTDTNPSEGQKEAGNYKKGHVKIDGFDVTIEQPKGSVRSGVDADGHEWSQEMHNTYGYIRGTEGVDGDHIDVFLSDHLDNWNGMVYVVDQVNKDGSFDEHKVMYGFDSEQEARDAYLSNYEEGWTGLGNITGVTRDEFKKWVDSSHRKTKPFAEYKSVKAVEEPTADNGGTAAANGTSQHELAAMLAEEFKGEIEQAKARVEIVAESAEEGGLEAEANVTVDGQPSNIWLVSGAGRTMDEYWKLVCIHFLDSEWQEIGDLADAYNEARGKEVCHDDADAKRINFDTIDDAVDFEQWHAENEVNPQKNGAKREKVTESVSKTPNSVSPVLEQVRRVKSKVPDALVLVRIGNEYNAYNEDAVTLHDVLGDDVSFAEARERGVTHSAGFSKDSLESLLPKLIKAGHKVSLVSGLEADAKMSKVENAGDVAAAVAEREAALRDGLVELLRGAGIEVVTDAEEGQRVLDAVNGRVQAMGFANSREEFDNTRDRAVAETGIVMTGLAEEEVTVVDVPRHDFTGVAPIKQAEAWGKKNLVTPKDKKGNYIDKPKLKDGTEYSISSNAVGKFLSKSATKNSDNLGVHLSVLKKLKDVIHESIEAEVHPDYKKDETGKRAPKNGYNPDYLVHRLYGAVDIDGKTYRVKTTIIENGNESRNYPHSYEVTEIELLDDSMAGSESRSVNIGREGHDTKNRLSNNSIVGAKLLQGVEKSYDPGKKLLDESEKSTESGVTVVTEVKKKGEVFNDFYTNKKASNQTPQMPNGDTPESARTNDNDANSGAKLQKVGDSASDGGEKVSSDVLFDGAKRKFGVTHDIREAGYVLPDGSMLDFSGRHELDPGTDSGFLKGQRTFDHRGISQISFVYDENGDEVDTGLETTMPDFIERGAIRIDYNAGNINLAVAPTAAQRRVLRTLIAGNGGDVQVDFGNGWDSDHYAEYSEAKAARVLADIDRYFGEGIKPQGDYQFFRTADGTAYGFVKDGRIYIDPRIATSETPIHEYTHLWCAALRRVNPAAWARLKEALLGQKDVVDHVKKLYPELEGDELMDEVFAHYSGRRGRERLQREQERELAKAKGIFDKARVVAVFDRIRRALDNFWLAARHLFAGKTEGLEKLSAEDFADMAMADLMRGFNPTEEVRKLDADGRKAAQLRLVTDANAMTDTYHTGIRRIDDIKTYEEAVAEGEGIGSYPDFTEDDARAALDRGRATVYSSHPIEPGSFVSMSRMEAEEYAGGGEVYSQEVPLEDVAWIYANEGQYAPVGDGGGAAAHGTSTQRTVPTFYSNAERAVEGVKQGKAKAEQWKAMLTKAGGIKAGEDKWMGLSQWLDEHKGETLTKEQVLEFVRQNGVQMEEVGYSEAPDDFESLKREYDQWLHDEGFDYAQEQLRERFGDDADIAFDDLGGELVVANEEAAAAVLGSENIINSTRLDYTTEGLENKREIAFVVPDVEPYREDDEIHFGPENQGRAVMWVRFGATTDTDGNRVLVIDEIQSNRHQDAREGGYRPREVYELRRKRDELKPRLKELSSRLQGEGITEEQIAEYRRLGDEDYRLKNQIIELIASSNGSIPAAPFEKNWHEVAMKRMLRLAAEEGFDKVAWTTGMQQAERYDIGKHVDKIEVHDLYDGIHEVEGFKNGVEVFSQQTENGEQGLAELLGKDMARKAYSNLHEGMTDYTDENGRVSFTGDNLQIGGEGMKGFYDQMLPRFMDKYGKKWGVKTGEVTLATPGQEVMHSVDVTPEMRRSVLEQGQPLFQKAGKKKSPQDEPQDLTTVIVSSRSDGTKIYQSIETAKNKLEKLSQQYKGIKRTRGFLSDLNAALGNAESGKESHYFTIVKDGKEIIIRTSNHNVNGENADPDSTMISVVIKSRRAPNSFHDGKADIKEYVYFKERIKAAESDVLSMIADGISDLLETGRFEDKTGIAMLNSTSDTTLTNDDVAAGDEVLFRELDDEEDAELIAELEGGPTVTTYSTKIKVDGGYIPPMSSKDNETGKMRKPEREGTWNEAEERPDMAYFDEKSGKWKFDLKKSNNKTTGHVDYNPYGHSGSGMLNDQFSEAQSRPDLVVVEMAVPESEVTSGYKAEKANDPVGWKPWKAGPITAKMTGTRQVMLSRWHKITREVPWPEVAQSVARDLGNQFDVLPTNTFPVQLRAELEKLGYHFIETNNKGVIQEGPYKGLTWTDRYYDINPELDKRKDRKKRAAHTAAVVRANSAQYTDNAEARLREALVEGGRLAIINQGGKWRIEGMPGEFGSRYAAIDEWRERAAGNVVWYLSEDGDYIEVEGNGDMYEMVSRTTTTSGRKQRERMARQQEARSRRGREMVDELADKLGIKVRYVEDMSEQERAQFIDRQLRGKGWYNPRTGEVFINLGRHTRLYDILSTFLHETVAHKGLRRLFGKDFNAFVDNVYNNVNKGIRAEIGRMAEEQKRRATEAQRARHDDEHWRRVATEEYMAKLAERLDLNHPEQRTLWEKIKGFLLDKLRKIGVTVADSLSDNDLRGILWESYHSMESEGVMGYAKGVAFRDQMEREANNRGGSRGTGDTAIAAEPQAQYTGSLFDMLPQAGAWARMMSNMSERELFKEISQDGPNVTSSYTDEYDRRHIKDYNRACDEIQARLERELPYADRLLELLQDAVAQWEDGAYKDERRSGVLAAIDTISRALDEEGAELPSVEDDNLYRDEDIDWDAQASKEELAEHLRNIPDRVGIKPSGITTTISDDSDLEALRGVVEDALYKDIVKNYNNPKVFGCYDHESGMIIVFTNKVGTRKEAESTWWHEKGHLVYDALSLKDKEECGRAAMDWLHDHGHLTDDQYNHYSDADRGTEGAAWLVKYLFENFGTDGILYGNFTGNGKITKLAAAIQNYLKNGEENDNNRLRQPADGQGANEGRSQAFGTGAQGPRGRLNQEIGDVDDGTIGAYNRAVNTIGKVVNVAGRDVKPRMTRYNFQEAFQDAILSVKKLQQVVCEAHGLDKLPSKEDAWTYENRLSSINMHARKYFIEKLYEPMMKAHDKLVKHGATVDEITEYVICKHGLERNQVFAERDAQRDADEIARNGGVPDIDALRDQYRQRDYSGLTAITGLDNIADIEADAQRRVDEFEQKHGQLCDELWSRINDATKWTLRRSYDGGMMSAQTYIKVRDMFQHYVPLRGWDETTAEDVYDYIMGDRGAFNGTLKTAMGRTSLADDPFATIGNMGESAIVQGNRNHLKQHLWNMATQHPTDVCQVRDMWVVLDAQGEWIADFPEIPEDADADTIAMILDDHETAMLDLESQDLAKRVRNNLDVGYRIDQRYIPEHAVVVMMNGDRHVVYINGNPRAAQAINGNLSSDKGSKNAIRRLVDFIFKDTRRYYSSVVTSYNINFSGANFVRDLPHAYAMTFTKYGWIKAAKYIVKSFQCIPWVIKNQTGHSGNSNMDQLFREFVAYGGVTGYAHINDIDSWKADNRRRMARLNALGKGTVGTLKGIKAVIHAVGWFSETLELIPRFTTYCASRDAGMDIQQSIKEAKDITTNFNKKGTEMTPGVWGAVANVLRYEEMFFNPIVQGMYQWFDVAKDSKAAKMRLAGVMLWMPVMGALVPYLNQFLLAAIGGDDDDDYFLQNEFTRRQNMLLWTGKGYAKIPIAPVFRELYGIGETIATRMCGRIDDRKTATDLVDQLRAAFSLEGQSSYREWSFARAAFPDHYGPIIDIMNNENFTGKSLWYESEWTKNKPEYTKAKESTWSPLVEASRKINGWLGGDDDIKADASGKWLNPVVWQHLLTNYGGGFAQVIGDASSTINNLAHGEPTDVSQWPIAKRFYTQPTEKRANWARYGIYKQYEVEFNKAKDKFSALKKRGLAPLEMAKEISEFAQRHPKAVGVYASWNGGINGADYVQKLKDLREKGDDAAYWATLKEAVEKADYAMRTGYARAWEQKRPSRPEFLDDDELRNTFDNSENDSVRAVMAKEIATRQGVQDYFSHDPYENYGDEAATYWNAYRRLRLSEDVVEDGKASMLLDDNEKEVLKKIKKQLGQGGDDEQIMDEYRRERRRLIEEHDNE